MPSFLGNLLSLFLPSSDTSTKPSARLAKPEVRQLRNILSLAALRHDQLSNSALGFRHRRVANRFHMNPRAAQVPAALVRNDIFFPDPWWSETELTRDKEEKPIRKLPDGSQVLVESRHEITLLDGRTVIQQRTTVRNSAGKRQKFFSAIFQDGSHTSFDEIPHQLLPLYGADKLSASDAGPIIICEGVPAADALIDRGFRAVATLTGALGTPSREALRPVVEAGPIVLWPDNDSVGVRHMERIARRLSDMNVQKVRIIRWVSAPRKADAANFPGSKEELQALIKQAQPWKPGSPISSRGILAFHAPRKNSQSLRLDSQEAPPVPSFGSRPAIAGPAKLSKLLRELRPYADKLGCASQLTTQERAGIIALLNRIGEAVAEQGEQSNAY